MTRPPSPDPTLFERTCYVVAIGAALLALILLAGCGKPYPTAPKPPPATDGSCWVYMLLPFDGGSVTLRAHYAVCPPDSTLKLLGWTREK